LQCAHGPLPGSRRRRSPAFVPGVLAPRTSAGAHHGLPCFGWSPNPLESSKHVLP
jgi:hypothetical protein